MKLGKLRELIKDLPDDYELVFDIGDILSMEAKVGKVYPTWTGQWARCYSDPLLPGVPAVIFEVELINGDARR